MELQAADFLLGQATNPTLPRALQDSARATLRAIRPFLQLRFEDLDRREQRH